MSWRYRLHRWLHDSPGCPIRFTIVNLAILVVFGAIPAVIDANIGRDELRWSLTIWFAFIVGVSAVATWNVFIRMITLDYNDVKAQLEDAEL